MDSMFRPLLGSLLLTVVAGCSIPTFEHPLVAPEKAEVPPGTFGLYRAKGTDGDGEGYVHVGPAGGKFPPGFVRIVVVNHPTNATTALESSQFVGFLEPIGMSYLFHLPLPRGEMGLGEQTTVWMEQWDASQLGGYLILRLAPRDGGLGLSMVDSEFVAAEITAGRLAGSVTEKQVGETSVRYKQILVTATSPQLKVFFTQHIDGPLFGKASTMLKKNDVDKH